MATHSKNEHVVDICLKRSNTINDCRVNDQFYLNLEANMACVCVVELHVSCLIVRRYKAQK
jgi:hypothetical protein